MLYKVYYQSPLGQLSLLADESALLGSWFCGQKYFEAGFADADCQMTSNPILDQARVWLDAYFAGCKPEPFPYSSAQGTAFQKRVWQALTSIPQGQTRTYGELAQALNCLSAQAVGGAVGRNPLSLFIPCHRVLGSQGQLTGYAAGLDKKRWLLEHEGLNLKPDK